MAPQSSSDRLPDIYSVIGNKGGHHTRPSNVASCSSATGSDGAEDGHIPKRRPMPEMKSDASSSQSVPDNHSSHFAGAHHFVCYGGTYNNILGNYMVFTEGQKSDSVWSLKLNGIIPGLPVLRREEVSLMHEIYKGSGYRFYSAQSSGRVVALKVYEGNCAKKRCSHDAGFYAEVMHPNIPLLSAVSPLASKYSFLVFDGEYEGTVDYILGKTLEKDLRKGLILGLQTVIGLSSGLDYLQDQRYPFRSIGLEHFVLLRSKQGVMISFNPEELGQMAEPNEQRSDNETNDASHVLHIFNELCQKTFDAARKDHYQNNQIRLASIEEDEGYISDDDILEDELGTGDTRQSLSYTRPGELSRDSTPKSARKRRRNGRRQELVWRSSTDGTIPLNEISRDFQYFLNVNASSLEPALNRRRGRYTARTPHRCPGYNRIEITLTSDITRSAIVFHSSPTPYEICPVCREVVKDAEIFNCVCGQDDDESIPTVRCSACSQWHHRPCAHFHDLDPQNFVCEHCKESDVTYKSDLSDSTSGAPSQSPPLLHRPAPITTVLEKHQKFLPSQVSLGDMSQSAQTFTLQTASAVVKAEVPSALPPRMSAKDLEQRYRKEEEWSDFSTLQPLSVTDPPVFESWYVSNPQPRLTSDAIGSIIKEALELDSRGKRMQKRRRKDPRSIVFLEAKLERLVGFQPLIRLHTKTYNQPGRFTN